MKQHLAVSAIGSDRTGMVHDLTRLVSECGGNISESRMAGLGSEFAMLLLVSGNWHALAKLEELRFKRLADSSGLILHLKRTEPRAARTDMLPYSIDVVSLDQSGIVSGLSGFFSSRSIDIAELAAHQRQHAMRGQFGQRLGEVEIVGEFRAGLALAVPHADFMTPRDQKSSRKRADQFGVLGEALGQDGARALQRLLDRRDRLAA